MLDGSRVCVVGQESVLGGVDKGQEERRFFLLLTKTEKLGLQHLAIDFEIIACLALSAPRVAPADWGRGQGLAVRFKNLYLACVADTGSAIHPWLSCHLGNKRASSEAPHGAAKEKRYSGGMAATLRFARSAAPPPNQGDDSIITTVRGS
jgi:hypothetical protein